MNAGNARYAILLLLSLSILAPGIAYAASTLTVSISYTPTIVVIGQSVKTTATVSGGTGGNTLQWYANSGCTWPIAGATSSSYSFIITGTTTLCAVVTDSASVTANAIVTINDPEIVYSTDEYQAYELSVAQSNSVSLNFLIPSNNMFAVIAAAVPSYSTVNIPTGCSSVTSQTFANVFVCGALTANMLASDTYTVTYSSANTQNVSIAAFTFANALISTYSTNSASGNQAGISFPAFGLTYICVAEVSSGNNIILNPGIVDYYLAQNSLAISHNANQAGCNTNVSTSTSASTELSGIGLYETVNPTVHYINGASTNVIITTGAGLSTTNTITNNAFSPFNGVIAITNLNLSAAGYTYNVLCGAGTACTRNGNTITVNSLNLSRILYTCGNGLSCSASNVISVNAIFPITSNSYGVGVLYNGNVFTNTAGLDSLNSGSGGGGTTYTAGYGIYVSPTNVISTLCNAIVCSLNEEYGNLTLTSNSNTVTITKPTSNTIDFESTSNSLPLGLAFNAPLYQMGNTVYLAYNSINLGLDVNNALNVIGMIPLSLLLLLAALAGAVISFRADDDFYKDLGGGIFVVFLVLFSVQTLFDYSAGPIEIGLVLLSLAALIFWMLTRFVNLLRLGADMIRRRS